VSAALFDGLRFFAVFFFAFGTVVYVVFGGFSGLTNLSFCCVRTMFFVCYIFTFDDITAKGG